MSIRSMVIFQLALLACTQWLAAAPVIDGMFVDWEDVPVTAADPAGDHGAAVADLLELRVTNDLQFLYIYLATLQAADLTGFNRVQVFFDTDSTTTGFVIANRLGSDFMILNAEGFDQRGGSFGGSPVPVSTASAASPDSRLFEFRVPLDVRYASDNELVFTTDTFKMLIAVEDTLGSQMELLPNTGALDIALSLDDGPTTGPEPEVLVYNVPLIASTEAPDTMDQNFDEIWSEGGLHVPVGGADWKAHALRETQPGALIGEPIASISRAWFLTDGINLYFGMIVYDPMTSQMTPDTGDNTGTKQSVESVTLGLAGQLGGAGEIGEVLWFGFDAFGNRDLPRAGESELVDPDRVQSNSYLITQNRWAVEMAVPIAELRSAAELPVNPFVWSAATGVRSPEPGPRVPWYNAAHADGLQKFHLELVLPINNAARDAWLLVE